MPCIFYTIQCSSKGYKSKGHDLRFHGHSKVEIEDLVIISPHHMYLL
ncbi:hypothetical protein HanIR_Chr12g0590611 [Helianthus annuus]|nr:hypothetical protein HanIR_Chr12g0590611 [Helianthus annuus]